MQVLYRHGQAEGALDGPYFRKRRSRTAAAVGCADMRWDCGGTYPIPCHPMSSSAQARSRYT